MCLLHNYYSIWCFVAVAAIDAAAAADDDADIMVCSIFNLWHFNFKAKKSSKLSRLIELSTMRSSDLVFGILRHIFPSVRINL